MGEENPIIDAIRAAKRMWGKASLKMSLRVAPRDRLLYRLDCARRLRACKGRGSRLLWIRAGVRFPPCLLSGQERQDLARHLIADLEGRLARTKHAKELAAKYRRSRGRKGKRSSVPLATPSPTIVGSYQEKFNSPPVKADGDDDLVAQACEYVRATTSGDAGGSFPGFPPFVLSFAHARDALTTLARRRTSGGLSRGTYRSLQAATILDPHLLPRLVDHINKVVKEVTGQTDFDMGVVPSSTRVSWPEAAKRVKLTLIPKTPTPDQEDPTRWRPLSNAEVAVKVPVEAMRRSLVGHLNTPLPVSQLVDRSKRFFSRFCSEGVLAEGLVSGGGPDFLTRYLQLRVDRARVEGSGLTVLFLDISNGFGSIAHDRILPALRAMGLDDNAAAFLTFIYVNGIAVLGDDAFKVLVGIFQGLSTSSLVFVLVLVLVWIASRPEAEEGFAASLIDDTAVYFSGTSSLSSRAGANRWLARAGPLLGAFGLSLNERKCAVLSLEGKDGITYLPSVRAWELSGVSLDGRPLPHLAVAPGQDALLQTKYLGRVVRTADSAKLKRSGIFDKDARSGANFSRDLDDLMDEVRKVTSGLPALLTLKRFNERLAKITYSRGGVSPPTPGEAVEMNRSLRRKVRSLFNAPGFLGNPISSETLHRPLSHWGFGVRNLEKALLVAAVKDLGRCLNMPRERNQPFSPVRLLLFEDLCAYIALYQEHPKWREALRDLEPVSGSFPAVRWNGLPLVIPLELLDGRPITRGRLIANFRISQFPYLLSGLVAAGGSIGPRKHKDGVPYRQVLIKGEFSTVFCETTVEAGRLASRAIGRRYPMFGHGTSTLVENARRGTPCLGAKSLQNVKGHRLHEEALLGPIAAVKYRLWRPGSVTGGTKNKANKRVSHGVCGACDGRAPPTAFARHVLGGCPSLGQGCTSTRRLVITRHAQVAMSAAREATRGRLRSGANPTIMLEVPIDTNLCFRALGKERQRADAVSFLPLEAVVTEATVSLSGLIAKGKGAQVESYVDRLFRATGIPRAGWATSALWRKVGASAFIVRVERHAGVIYVAHAHAEGLRFESRNSSSRGSAGLRDWFGAALGHVTGQVSRAGSSRVIFIAHPNLERWIRREWADRDPGLDYTVVKPRGTDKLAGSGPMVSLGPAAVVNARDKADLGWPRCLLSRTRLVGPLRIVPSVAAFDPLGTAYPITTSSLLGAGGNSRVMEIGASILRLLPKFVKEWRRKVAKRRVARLSAALRVNKKKRGRDSGIGASAGPSPAKGSGPLSPLLF